MPHRTSSSRNDYERKINYDWPYTREMNHQAHSWKAPLPFIKCGGGGGLSFRYFQKMGGSYFSHKKEGVVK